MHVLHLESGQWGLLMMSNATLPHVSGYNTITGYIGKALLLNMGIKNSCKGFTANYIIISSSCGGAVS